ncbi:hypothetical protein [uncultured Vibrio sp.]|uniref:hypothetical protein n=1 Tax=uncultured Vibrio sp. TaxID=114054 RepID=UPI0025F7FA16|nr:hypothetical protein [uncultured Vibrio sp.]
MAFSIKKIFTNKQAETEQAQSQEEKHVKDLNKGTVSGKKAEHKAPTGCCGSCS